MPTSLSLKVNFKGFERKLNKEIRLHTSKAMFKAATRTAVRIGKLFEEEFLKDPITQELMHGGGRSLRAELGLTNNVAKINSLVQTWINGIDVKVRRVKSSSTGHGVTGGFSVSMIRSDWTDVLNSDAALQLNTDSENPKSRQILPWLEWLLIDGGNILVRDYDVSFKPGSGRTGQAIMVKGDKLRWSVPEFAQGTTDNNWVTKILLTMSGKIEQIMIEEISKEL